MNHKKQPPPPGPTFSASLLAACTIRSACACAAATPRPAASCARASSAAALAYPVATVSSEASLAWRNIFCDSPMSESLNASAAV